jgi:hypothetical protein
VFPAANLRRERVFFLPSGRCVAAGREWRRRWRASFAQLIGDRASPSVIAQIAPLLVDHAPRADRDYRMSNYVQT